MEKKKILIADDEVRITALVSDFFTAAGYAVIIANDGAEAMEKWNENRDVSAVILDIMMPETDGWQVCSQIRAVSDVPIVMLTARSEEFDQLMGFESGANEYVTKPFSPAVLVKRIDALIRLNQKSDAQNEGLKINADAYTVTVDGKIIDLTLKEFEILRYLYENKGRVFTRDQILVAVWGYDFEGDDRTVDSHMARLRTKLGLEGTAHIKTVYGLGYKFED